MENKASGTGPLLWLWKLFASVKLSVVVLITLAVTSIFGTIIPQNGSHEMYFHKYGEVVYRLLSAFDLFDMYQSWWFQLLLLLLAMNLIVCSIDRLGATWKIIFPEKLTFKAGRFKGLSGSQSISSPENTETFKKNIENYLSGKFSVCMANKTENGYQIFAEKGRWTRLGVYGVHLSILLLLAGGFWGSVSGYSGEIKIDEGQKGRQVTLKGSKEVTDLDFEIACDDFDVSFYDTGAPKEFRSKLRIIENGETVIERDIIVNDPLRYKGVSIYQASYGTSTPSEFTLGIQNRETGEVHRSKSKLGDTVELPGGLGEFKIEHFAGGYRFRGHNLGDTFFGILTETGEKPVPVMLPIKYHAFDKMRKGSSILSIEDYVPSYYTGLQVTKDPGVWLVYAGFIIMILGCYVTFFMSHQSLFVEIEENGKETRATVAGTANKNKLGMKRKVDQIADKLAGI